MPRSLEDIKKPRPSDSVGQAVPGSNMVKAKGEVIEKLVQKRPAFEPSTSGPHASRTLWIAAGIAVVVAIFYISTLFTIASVAVMARRAQVDLDRSFTLSFQTVDVKADEAITVPANGTRAVSQKASGKVLIYNTGNTSQRLVATTRLQAASNGKIYRIDKSITIPAGGSLEVTAYADAAGPSYNTGLTDFTVPGLRGTSRYEKVYGRSKTSMMGGFTGQMKVVAEQDLERAKSELESKLREKMLSDVRLQIPDKFVLLPGATSVRFDAVTQEAGGSADATTATLKQTGYITALVFDREDLSREIAASGAAGYEEGDEVVVENLEELELSLTGGTAADLKNAKTATFNLKGNAQVVWQYDTNELKKSLLGTRKKEFNDVLSRFKAIESAQAKFTPPWARRFPKNPDKLRIDPDSGYATIGVD